MLSLADDLPRLIHHLGPRYTGTFQDPQLIKFLTYEASTSLNMYLGTVAATSAPMVRQASSQSGGGSRPVNTPTPIVKALREGMQAVGLKEETVLFVVSPAEFEWGIDSSQAEDENKDAAGVQLASRNRTVAKGRSLTTLVGDVFVVKTESLDDALWKIGGAAVSLRLVQLASVSDSIIAVAACVLTTKV